MNQMQTQRMNQKQLFQWITMLGFCADDMMLYLDTHPKDKEGLAYYKECMELYQNAKKNYEENYGPLTVEAAKAVDGVWSWSTQPLPWEGVL